MITMSRIPNWDRTEARNVSDIHTMSGTVREWTNRETGDTVTIRWMDPDDSPERYDIQYNGEAVDAEYALTRAEGSVRETLRACPEGIEG